MLGESESEVKAPSISRPTERIPSVPDSGPSVPYVPSRLEQLFEVPMLVAALAVIPLAVAEYMLRAGSPALRWVLAADHAIWALFVVEFASCLVVSRSRVAYVRRNWFNLIIVLLPPVRPLRALRVFRLLRITRVLVAWERFTRHLWSLLGQNQFGYTLAALGFALAAGALAMLEVERPVNPMLKSHMPMPSGTVWSPLARWVMATSAPGPPRAE